ncbi:MAG: hypothetical protein FJ399_11955 [Verrucomicrobia bacterium]|nr:hypothetical protein [Verrucomicrobiota bacterium]
MNREEAQFILGAYRPNGEDARDAQFREALDLVRLDPELARWFTTEQALDRAIAARLSQVPPPPNLRAQLLLARKTVAPIHWWRQPRWLAAAAAVVLLAAFVPRFLRPTAEAGFAAFRTEMTSAAFSLPGHLGVTGLGGGDVKTWLAAQRGAPDFVLPPALAAKGIAGCKVLEWRGRKVTMLCFKPSGKHVDLFVMDAADLPTPSLSATPAYTVAGDVTTAEWQSDGKIYLLAGKVPRGELQALL